MAMSSLSIFVLTFFMQELPVEVKGDYLRRADLLMRPQDTAGQPSVGQAQVGRHPGGPAQVGGIGGIWDWDCVGHAQPVGQDAVGHPTGQVEILFF